MQLGALAGIAVATWVVFGGRQAYSGLMFAISLLLVIGDGSQQLSVALWRSADVMLGTLVGIGATLVFLPHKATDMLRFLLADCLDRMARLYHTHTSATSAPGHRCPGVVQGSQSATGQAARPDRCGPS